MDLRRGLHMMAVLAGLASAGCGGGGGTISPEPTEIRVWERDSFEATLRSDGVSEVKVEIPTGDEAGSRCTFTALLPCEGAHGRGGRETRGETGQWLDESD